MNQQYAIKGHDYLLRWNIMYEEIIRKFCSEQTSAQANSK